MQGENIQQMETEEVIHFLYMLDILGSFLLFEKRQRSDSESDDDDKPSKGGGKGGGGKGGGSVPKDSGKKDYKDRGKKGSPKNVKE